MRRQVRAMTLFLIGLRGTGKTTVGRRLAERLCLPFLDADAELELSHGRTIRDIFATDGEAAFRELEAKMLEALIARGSVVIATGGGVVLREQNRQRMQAAGKIVWLTADTDTLWRRIEADSTTPGRRPDLGGGGREEIEQLQQQREPCYRSCADWIVPTEGRSPEQIADAILALCSTS